MAYRTDSAPVEQDRRNFEKGAVHVLARGPIQRNVGVRKRLAVEPNHARVARELLHKLVATRGRLRRRPARTGRYVHKSRLIAAGSISARALLDSAK
jgi:hypothetical protein